MPLSIASQLFNTAAGWAQQNQVVPHNVIGIESDTGAAKIGDGRTTWGNLQYLPTGWFPAPPLLPAPGMLQLQATTGTAGYALQNGTATILSWNTPADGALHRAIVFGAIRVNSPETGGAIQLHFVLGGSTGTPTLQGGGTGNGVFQFSGDPVVIDPGTNVTIVQTSALTAGAAVLWAEIWGL